MVTEETRIGLEVSYPQLKFESFSKFGSVSWAVLIIQGKRHDTNIRLTLWYPSEQLVKDLEAAFGPPEEVSIRDMPTPPKEAADGIPL